MLGSDDVEAQEKNQQHRLSFGKKHINIVEDPVPLDMRTPFILYFFSTYPSVQWSS